eukprot:6192097-Pleurochrysis_carterae.AAC.2
MLGSTDLKLSIPPTRAVKTCPQVLFTADAFHPYTRASQRDHIWQKEQRQHADDAVGISVFVLSLGEGSGQSQKRRVHVGDGLTVHRSAMKRGRAGKMAAYGRQRSFAKVPRAVTTLAQISLRRLIF